MKIGVVSDTHGFFDQSLNKALAGVELILHAGDVGREEVLDQLRQIAPVVAVRGNVDGPDLNLPLSLTMRVDELRIQMMHILPVPQAELEAWSEGAALGGKAPARSERFFGTFDDSSGAVIFGHSHRPCLVSLGGRLFCNPGSAGKKRFSLPRCCGLLETLPDGVQATIRLLEGYNGRALKTMRFDVEVGAWRLS